MRKSLLAALAAAALLVPAASQSATDYPVINRIMDEGFNHSQVMNTAEYLADQIGPRLTNSPNMRKAEAWTSSKFSEWGLQNVHKEGFPFGRGWWIESSSVRMTSPRPIQLTAIPIAWTPSTNGTVTGEVVVAPMTSPADFAKWRGKLKGKIVLVTKPDSGSEPDQPAFKRYTDEAIANDVRFDDSDPNAYDIIADIPGTAKDGSYVMAGAHLDSWVAGDGAADNGAGSAMIMEAARILAKMPRPNRTIRFALWAGEEQGLLGSLAYVENHFATRGGDASATGLARYMGWGNRWPITTKPEWSKMAAYFNIDNGSGKLRGIYAENNPAVVPIFKEWLAPFNSMGASSVVIRKTGGTDHVFMQAVGLPGFQFIQDPLDYGSRIHHSSLDTFDHLKGDDMRQASVILATFLWNAANGDALPRPPLPTQPVKTDPFAYGDE